MYTKSRSLCNDLNYKTQGNFTGREESLTMNNSKISLWKRIYLWIITFEGGNEYEEDTTKNYHSIPLRTNYMFFLGGRFRTVKRSRHYSIIVFAIMVVPGVLFSVFECSNLWHTHHGYKALVFFFYYFWAMCIFFFIKVSTNDAGVLPRNIHIGKIMENNNKETIIIPDEYTNTIRLPVANKNHSIELKYCSTCHIWRPPRASHCSICQACIDVHDHHCIWINNCVGNRNYRYFIIFLVGAILSSIFIIINCSIHVARIRRASNAPVAILLIVYGCLTIIYPGILLGYHIALTGTGQTTREFLHTLHGIKNPMLSRVTRARDNAFDSGSFFHNMIFLMAQRQAPSFLPSRGTHSRDDWRFR
ncbi:hypothetical protein TBLA_0H00920 [Henningerozyma blattae CBS 6284]|uniref:Palmitoyltransferase n=1 Tax=Henningerozyma blattae (strain ATCC 34711 / CBS 6284 / DSM 70876 / NBRC 10599 / NRRL Y-10934 / UCD 77-7) TaxID=1071380 RepID=I2H7M9_HENB6|nr:hypothetical protein TBLA_0H00920 [Tetrapisispora blattae CBS 6284]CCH62381.1 hypothetical protein TBLA_0H00920 [Tetrapisispora blattae CBS 6284]